MAAIAPLKNSPYLKKWMAQADPPKQANAVKKWMVGRFFSFQIKWHIVLKNGRLQVLFWKNILSFQKFDDLNRSS